MLDIHRALNNDRLMRALTGLNRKAFDELLVAFAAALQAAKLAKPRQRAPGGGKKAQLSSDQEKLFYILFYFKCYPTCDVAGFLFDFDRSQANRWMHRLQAILEAALGEKMTLPERKLETIEQFLVRYPEVKEVMIDGTERPIARPKDREKQKHTYSGKKKRNTRKHLGVVDETKRVIGLSKAREGKVHDKRLLDEETLVEGIPDEIPIQVDLGFQGLQNEFVNIEIPHKKPKGKELSDLQKQQNQERSSRRVRCENAFAGVKRYRAVSEVYRNRVTDFDDRLMLTACGLWNFYLMVA
ncbi:MAG: transposase [Leptolyngbyaceae cyanobacterium SM1_4_3]|nr:transposase [Leptolyngbyaceae cyanobacterium SM1_4_3]